MRWSSLIPNKTDAPLIVDPDRMLPLAIGSQSFEAIARRHAQIGQRSRLIQKTQLSQSDILDVRRQFSAPTAGLDQLCLGIGEALDHDRL
jgi:hypothetical protein